MKPRSVGTRINLLVPVYPVPRGIPRKEYSGGPLKWTSSFPISTCLDPGTLSSSLWVYHDSRGRTEDPSFPTVFLS